MSKEDQPTSEWEHSHALTEGDKIEDTDENTPITVTEVRDDGSIKVKQWFGSDHGEGDYVTAEYTEGQTRVALADGIFERTDGKSHELTSF